jgi:hypothetical protein
MLAIGRPSTTIRPVGSTFSDAGAMPNVQFIKAPEQTFSPTVLPPFTVSSL